MARHLLDPGNEKYIHDMKWKHGDAMIAVLGERIVALDFFPPYHGHHGTFRSLYANWKDENEESTSRPLVSWLINRSGKHPLFDMATETCSIHDSFPPKRKINEAMDGCRFRDDVVSAMMLSRVRNIIPVDSSIWHDRYDHDHYFRTVSVTGRDDEKLDTIFRFFSAFPDRAAEGVFSSIEGHHEVMNRVVLEIESVAGRYAARNNKVQTRALQTGLEIMFRKSPPIYIARFGQTRNPIIAREVARTIARQYNKALPRTSSGWSGRTEIRSATVSKNTMDRIDRMGNPVIGDAIVALLSEKLDALPTYFDRCLVAGDVITRSMSNVITSEKGHEMASKYYEEHCGGSP